MRDLSNGALRRLVEHPFRVVAIALSAEVAVAFAAFGGGLEGMQAAARYSGRSGLLLFGVVFALSPLHHFRPSPWTREALRRRRFLGLAFGAHHLVHLALLLAYQRATGNTLDLAGVAGGAAAYVFLVAMMATSSDAAVRTLGRRAWQVLHRTGLWVLWFAFFMTYEARIRGVVPDAGGSMTEFVACMSIVVAMAVLRIVASFSKRRAASAAAAPS